MFRSLRVVAVVGAMALLSPTRDGSGGLDRGSGAALSALRTVQTGSAAAEPAWSTRLWAMLPDSVRAAVPGALVALGAMPGFGSASPHAPRPPDDPASRAP